MKPMEIKLPSHMKAPTGLTTESSSETCDQHPYRKSKPVYKLIVDGEEVCPLCETERMTKELAVQQQENYETAKSLVDYNIFQNKNVVKDESILNATFTSFLANQHEEVENKARAITAFKQYNKGKKFNTWLTGSPGVGKSHLAMSILNNLNEKGEKKRSCLFVSVDEMLLRIRDSFDKPESQFTEMYFVNLLSRVDYLVLDDLGAETGAVGTRKKATDFTQRVLYAIANGRQSKCTIVTSNLSIPALQDMYDTKLISRLLRDTFQIHFENTSDKRVRRIEFEED